MKKSIYTLAILGFILMLSGCASVQKESLAVSSKAKQFTPEKELANIYLYRNEVFGGAIRMNVTVDSKLAGATGPMTFFNWKLEPGKHVFKSLTENTAVLTLDVDAGKSYFIWQEVKMGMWAAGSQLHEVTYDTGKEAVLNCDMLYSEI